MARPVVALTDKTIQNAKATDKPRRLFDGGGLHVLVNPDGSKYWRLKFLFGGKEKRIGLGVYPEVGLADARVKAAEARKLLGAGIDPSAQRKADKASAAAEQQLILDTFEVVARAWYELKRTRNWATATARKADEALTIDLIPALGCIPIADLKTSEVKAALRAIEQRSPHMAHKAQQYCSAIVRYAIEEEKREEGKFLDLRGALNPLGDNHFAAFGEKDLPGFLKKLDGYGGAVQTRIAIKLLMLTFVRPSELTGAAWAEFDLDAAEWRIPAERMKMKQPHIVPLSNQAMLLLRELHTMTAYSPFLFPSERAPLTKPMARDTLSKVLRVLGYQGMATPHGFRAMASAMLNEMGFHPDWIELQLAHREPNKIRRAYNHAKHLAERRGMMQHWGKFLDEMAKDGKVLAFEKSAA